MSNGPGTPLLSVVMAVYNAGPYLREAVNSILNQSFSEYEFIIVNDGSSDDSLDILTNFASRDSRIKLISRENKGFVASLLEGISHASGKYIARMDADDISLPNRFGQQIEYLETHPDVVCVGGHIEHIDHKSRIITQIKYPKLDSEIQSLLIEGHATICHPASMFRASAYQRAGGYRTDCFPAEDLDLWLRLGEVGELANLDSIVIRYRMLESSISGSKRLEQRKAAELACQLAWQRRGIAGEFKAHAPWRPESGDKLSQLEFCLKFGWQAYNYRQRFTAFVYALKGIKIRCFDRRPWILLLSTLRPVKG